jgi:hypothetical protein
MDVRTGACPPRLPSWGPGGPGRRRFPRLARQGLSPSSPIPPSERSPPSTCAQRLRRLLGSSHLFSGWERLPHQSVQSRSWSAGRQFACRSPGPTLCQSECQFTALRNGSKTRRSLRKRTHHHGSDRLARDVGHLDLNLAT